MGNAVYDALFAEVKLMTPALTSPTKAWLLLLLASFIIWGLYELSDKDLMIIAVLLSAVKVIVIGLHFMDLNFAKKAVIRFYFAWVFAVSLLFIASEILV